METKKQRVDYVRKMKNLKYSELIDNENIVTADNLRVTISRENDKVDYYLSLIAKKHNISEQWLISGFGSFNDPYIKVNLNKEEALQQLSNIKKNKQKTSEGRLIDESELVPVEQYIIPIKGQAGLKKAFFYPDEYVEENFEKELAYVKPKDRAVYHKIEVDGGSMPGVLNPGEWARCVEIPKNLWLEKGTFKPDKIYCLWHKDLGILFKRISKVRLDVITLSSDNTDKNDYPDQDFQLIEFSKILIVKMKEVIL